LGLTLSDLSDEQRKEARVRAGVRVDAAVDAAARAGIREGDLILAVANAEVASVQLFETLVARMDKTKPVSVLIRRGNAADFVTIRPAP
jgi:serine protease Do